MAGRDMANARAPRACEVCGREVSGNNYARHLATHANGDGTEAQPKRRTRRKSHMSASTISKGIGRFLDSLEYTDPNNVPLGALEGFPQSTRDPEVVARAIEVIRARDDGGTIARLKRQQRIINLTRALETMETNGNGDSPRAFFVEHAAEWAEANGVGYSAFRAMGVPPSVLTEAGIGRTFEP